MKRIKLLLAAFAAMVGMSAYAQTDAQYDAAIAAIQDGGKYSIVAEYNSSSYYLKKDGYLTDKLTEAGVFTFTAASPSGAFKPTGFKTNQFTNGGAQNNTFSGDALKRIVTSTYNRDTWEAQAYFLNEEGYFAIRSTNAVSDSWGAGAYWTVVDDVDSDGLPNATYTMDDVPFVWKLQDGEIALVAIAKVELAQVMAEAEAKNISTTAANAVYENASATSAEVNAAISALKKEMVKAEVEGLFVGASATSPVDVTSLITNPAPYVNANGWNVSKAPTFDSDNKNAEFWNSGAAYIKQTLSYLPAGSYILEAIAFTRTGMHGILSAGEASMEIATVGSGTVNGRGAANTWFNNGNGVNKLFFSLDAEAENFEIGLTTDNTTGDHWTVWRSFSLKYYGDATEEEIALVEAAADLQKAVDATAAYDGKIPAAAYAALQKEVTAQNKEYTSLAEYSAASLAITNAVNTYATPSIIAAYSHYNKKKAAALAVDDDTDAYEGDARVDLTDADAAVEAATTVEEIQAAEPLIENAVGAFLEAVNLKSGYRFDITDVYLENTDFSAGNIGSWETNYVSGQQAQNIGYQGASYTNGDITISQFIESWLPAGNGNIGNGYLRQTVKALPEGQYSLEADGIAVKQNDVDKVIEGAYLFIYAGGKYYGKEKSLNTGNEKPEHFTTSFVHMGEGEIQFGLMTENATCNWLCADNFKVYYTGAMPLEVYEELFSETLTLVQDYDKEVPKAALDALMEIAEEQDKSWSSKEEYLAAITVINNAVEATDALVAPYADYKALVKECEPLQAVDNDNKAANATFQAAIESEAIEDCKTLEDIAAVKAALAQACLTYVAEANPANGAKFDLTFMLTNPNLEGLPTWAKAEGWYTEQTDGNSQVMVNDNATSEDGTKTAFFEYWKNPAAANNLFALYQKVTLPAGTYNMSCYAFAQDDETHVNHPNGVYFYANDVQGSAVNNARLSQAQIEFVNATEQEVKIGLKTVTGNANFWMGIGYVELYKIAPKTIEIAENVDFEPVAAAGEVTLTRTIKADTWNTFVVPFQITNEELKAAFGDDVEVAEESEVAHGDLSTISFTKMETPAITPNKPVLLKTSTAGTVYNFEGRTIATSEPVVIGTNFDFVGTYASGKIAAGDYFIGSDKLFLSDGNVNVAGTHAYLKAKAVGVKAELFIDGVATAIESIDAETAQPAGAIYNVAGQRVQKAQRGLYIMGGKKVVVK